MAPYACADVHYTYLLFKQLISELCQDTDLSTLYQNEMKLLRELFNTESSGAKIDLPYLQQIGPEVSKRVDDYAEQVYTEFGYRFNIGSNPELIKALQSAGVKLTKLTKKSKENQEKGIDEDPAFSVDEEVLEKLASKYSVASVLLQYRKNKKLKGTYIDGISKFLDNDCFLHPSYTQNVSTGRMGCSEPNLQNVPAGDKLIRRAFIVPSDEYYFVFMDFSQIELRLASHFSQDESLLACYPKVGKGLDVHTLTTAEAILGISYEDALALQMAEDEAFNTARSVVKTTNFAVLYQGGPKALQLQISTPNRQYSEQECREFIDGYFRKYPGVKDWMRLTTNFMLKHGYVQNYFGRYRRFPNTKGMEQWQRNKCARQACNAVIQSTAADLFKYSIVRVAQFLKGKKTRLVNFVHDEIQFYWHKDELHLIPEVKRIMEDFDLSVPIVADVSMSETDWSTKKKYTEIK
jgi:DNA polymerase-1